MKIYISGKISDLNMDDVQIKFARAERFLIVLGYEVVNPLNCHDNPDVPCPNPTTWEEYMLNDIKEIFGCDAIYLLEDWQDSVGAKVEHAICSVMGKKVFYARENSMPIRIESFLEKRK